MLVRSMLTISLNESKKIMTSQRTGKASANLDSPLIGIMTPAAFTFPCQIIFLTLSKGSNTRSPRYGKALPTNTTYPIMVPNNNFAETESNDPVLRKEAKKISNKSSGLSFIMRVPSTRPCLSPSAPSHLNKHLPQEKQ